MTKREKALADAARRMLEFLHDDHEDCYCCLRQEGLPHDRECACGELSAALRIEPRQTRR